MNLRQYAKGQCCMVRIPGVCNFDNETTVLAHLGGAGMGRKGNDLIAAWCCSACHDVVDGRVGTARHKNDIDLCLLEGIIRTQRALLEAGLAEVIEKWAKTLEV